MLQPQSQIPVPRGSLLRWFCAAFCTALVLAIVGALLQLPGTVAAMADTAPAAATEPTTVSSDALPTAQIDGVAWDQVVVGNTVYVGGKFTTARPAGAAAGTGTVARSNMLAYNLTTGKLIGNFAPSFNGEVLSLAASPDGSTIFTGGNFTTVDGKPRKRLAALNVRTGQLTAFAPTFNATVYGVATHANLLYAGGNFTSVNGVTRNRAAAIDTSTGAVTGFNPAPADHTVRGIAPSPDGSTVALAGSFTKVGDGSQPSFGLARVTASDGTALSLPANSQIANAGDNAAIYSLKGDASGFYGTGYLWSGSTGNTEGAFRVDWNGELSYVSRCYGDSYDAAAVSGVLYIASHTHDCTQLPTGGFGETLPLRTHYFATAMTDRAAATSFGTPEPALLNWYPTFQPGTYTASKQAVWTVETSGDYVVYGGEFTKVNGVAQQGLVRFARPSIAPNKDGPRLSGSNFTPTAVSPAAGTVRLTWPANYDRDNATLTYTVSRDTGAGWKTVRTLTRTAQFWASGGLSLTDTGLAGGATPKYRVRVSDPFGNSVTSPTAQVTVASSGSLTGYQQSVLDDGANAYWPLGDNGSIVRDLSGADTAPRGSGVSPGGSSATGGSYSSFNGTPDGTITSTRKLTAPDVFSTELWFRTTSTSGGKLAGFTNQSTCWEQTCERQLYLDNDGHLNFGVFHWVPQTITTSGRYNDGNWHQAVATLGVNGMALYVDGAKVASNPAILNGYAYLGYWKIGGDGETWGGDKFFTGDLSDAAFYPTALTPAQVNAHWTAAGRPSTLGSSTLTAAVTTSANDLTISANGSGSSSATGTVASYDWNFGDPSAVGGGVAQGPQASHTYAANGTYPITLTVADADGRTATTTRTVTVSVPGVTPGSKPFMQDTFTRRSSTSWGSPWTSSGVSKATLGVNGSAGTITLTAKKATAGLSVPSASRNVLVVANVSMSRGATGGGTVVALTGRVSRSSSYQARLLAQPGGTGTVQLVKISGTTTKTLASKRVFNALATGQKLTVAFSITGSATPTLAAKVWRTGSVEPSAWQVSSKDSSQPLNPSTSRVGVWSLVSGTATALPQTVSVDHFAAYTR